MGKKISAERMRKRRAKEQLNQTLMKRNIG